LGGKSIQKKDWRGPSLAVNSIGNEALELGKGKKNRKKERKVQN
jgi:hypothetical protein